MDFVIDYCITTEQFLVLSCKNVFELCTNIFFAAFNLYFFLKYKKCWHTISNRGLFRFHNSMFCFFFPFGQLICHCYSPALVTAWLRCPFWLKCGAATLSLERKKNVHFFAPKIVCIWNAQNKILKNFKTVWFIN